MLYKMAKKCQKCRVHAKIFKSFFLNFKVVDEKEVLLIAMVGLARSFRGHVVFFFLVCKKKRVE